ncbi:MAG TPA: bacteriohemerythrin [Candidatus Sulfotelmatobacter sp.]|jgi:hemerythrin|nr:bacteriohemerythrin [Candidatus Sulfotelmatobacter sp.]
MPLISWAPAFDTGFDVIDREHRALADALNRMHQAQENGGDGSVIATHLGEIARHISIHFAHEEQIMTRLNYPGREAHWREHIELLSDMADVMDEYEAGSYDNSPDALNHYLKFWLLTHIMTEDVKLASFLIQCQREGLAL